MRASTDGSIKLLDGSHRRADLIAADGGLHSVLRGTVLGQNVQTPSLARLSAFRVLIETKDLHDDPKLAAVLRGKGSALSILTDTRETASERHMMWYPCRK